MCLFKDPETENDLVATYNAIDKVAKKSLESSERDLTSAQKWLFRRHWVLETIDTERPALPKKFDTELMNDALKNVFDLKMDNHNSPMAVRFSSLVPWETGNVQEERGSSN